MRPIAVSPMAIPVSTRRRTALAIAVEALDPGADADRPRDLVRSGRGSRRLGGVVLFGGKVEDGALDLLSPLVVALPAAERERALGLEGHRLHRLDGASELDAGHVELENALPRLDLLVGRPLPEVVALGLVVID